MAGEFSTINVRLIANAAGMDSGLNDGASKVQGFAGKFGSLFEKGLELLKGGDIFGAVGGVFESLKGIGGALSPVITAASTAFLAIKGIHDLVGDSKDNGPKPPTKAELERKEQEEAERRRRERQRQETVAPIRSVFHLNEALNAQIATFGQAANLAQIYATKLDLVRTGVLKAKDAFVELSSLTPIERANRQFNDLLRNLDEAEFRARRLSDRQRGKEIGDQVRTPLQQAQKDFDEAKKLFGQGDLSRADFGRRAFGLLEQLERLNPTGESQFARATQQGSVEAARDLLRAQQAASARQRDPGDRLKEAIDRQRVIEEEQLRVQEELLKKITGPGGVFIANF